MNEDQVAETNILLVVSEPQLGELLERGVLSPAGYQVTLVSNPTAAKSIIRSSPIELVILEIEAGKGDPFALPQDLLNTFPAVPLILVGATEDQGFQTQALRTGIADYLVPPLKPERVLESVRSALEHRLRIKSWVKEQSRHDTDMLRRRVNVLETLGKVGRSVTASLELDDVLKTVVDAAVELTGAEEGSLLVLDEDTGELYMRAARNFQDDFVRTFRLPADDSLAGEVIRTGKPILLDEEAPQKIKTSYLVKSLIYEPLRIHGRVIGVLGVDNRESERAFQSHELTLVSALADYAAIAIENARLFENTEIERNKLEEILARIEDGVIVVDENGLVVLVNRVARELLQLDDKDVFLQPYEKVLTHEELVELFRNGQETFPYRAEIELGQECVINAQLSQIPDVGLAVTMHDVTKFKELDRVKSDFVSTVSHDLRSPLTAILGYVELLERVGPLNERQKGFVERVQVSVRNITDLINDLLDLGRIESGFDEGKEFTSLVDIVKSSVEELRNKFLEKEQQVSFKVGQEELPRIFGDTVRLRQVVDNLLGNAIRYTPKGGKIDLTLHEENEQLILRVVDSGVGIPASERPHIFNKFYRASNVAEKISGSGLGLAIVKSIVENHQGRIWVDSSEGEGSTFTVVLPIADQE